VLFRSKNAGLPTISTGTGLSLFRQLPAGVAGAYRLALNLVAPAESEVAP
jgi:hypothetical protein